MQGPIGESTMQSFLHSMATNWNMSQFQTGGVKGKGVTDNLFILRGIVDHSKYLGLSEFIVGKWNPK